MLAFRESLVLIEIDGSFLNALGLAHIIEDDGFFREQSLEYIRNCELSTGSGPLSAFFRVIARYTPIASLTPVASGKPSNINRVVDKTHLSIGRFMLEGVTIALSKVHAEVDNLRSSTRDLDGVGLDMGHLETSCHNLILQGLHEQCATQSNNVIDVASISEGIIEARTSQTVHGVDGNLKGLSQRLCLLGVIKVLSKSSAEELLCLIVFFMLHQNTSIENIFEVLGVVTEEVKLDDAIRMQTSNVHQTHFGIHTGFGINISAKTEIHTAIHIVHAAIVFLTRTIESTELISIELVLGIIGSVSRHARGEISIDELRMLVLAKYNSGGQGIGCVIDCHVRDIGQNLASNKVSLTVIPSSLSCFDIVFTISSNLIPPILGNVLIPRNAEFLMVNAQVNLEFLKTLLLGAEVVNISVAEVIRFAKETLLVVDDVLGKTVQLLVVETNEPCVKHMVIVLAVIKTNKPILKQGLDIRGRRINHFYDLLLFTLEFPAHDKQVRKHFTVEEYNWCIRSDWSIIFTVFRLEVHDTNFLHTVFCIMTTTSSKSSNDVTHVANIITERRIVCIVKDLLNEVD